MASSNQKEWIINLFREYPSYSLICRVIAGRGLSSERSALSIVLLAIQSSQWPTSFAHLISLQALVNRTRLKHETQMLEYQMAKQFNLWNPQLFLRGISTEPPPIPLILILGDQTESEILEGLKKLQRGGFIELCENSIVTPTESFFDAILTGCREQVGILSKSVPD